MFALKTLKRKIERARELKLIVPDPFVLLSGLDTMTEKVVKRDQKRSFRSEGAREATKLIWFHLSKPLRNWQFS